MLFARFLPYEKSSTEIESAEGASDEFFYSSYTKHSNNPQFWAETCDFTPNVLKRSPKFRAEQTQRLVFIAHFSCVSRGLEACARKCYYLMTIDELKKK